MEKFEIKELKAKLKVASREDFNYLGKDMKQYPKVGFPYFWKTADGNYHFGFTRLIMDKKERTEAFFQHVTDTISQKRFILIRRLIRHLVYHPVIWNNTRSARQMTVIIRNINIKKIWWFRSWTNNITSSCFRDGGLFCSL